MVATGVNQAVQLFSGVTKTFQTMASAYQSASKAYNTEQSVPNEGANRTGVKQQVYGDLSSFMPERCFAVAADMQQSGSMPPEMLGLSTESPEDLMQLAKLWYVRDAAVFFNADVWALPIAPLAPARMGTGVSGDPETHGYLPRICQFYNYYRGTMKIRIKIFSSQLITWRLIFQLYYDSSEWEDSDLPSAETLFDKSGDVLTEVVTVKGNDTFEMVVPFIRESQLARVDDLAHVPILFIGSLGVTPSIVASGNTSCFLQVEQCAGDDFILSRFVGDKHFDITPSEDLGVGHGRINSTDVVAEKTSIEIIDGNSAQNYFYTQYASNTNLYSLLLRPSLEVNQEKIEFPGKKLDGVGGFISQWSSSTLLDKISQFFLFYNGPTNHKAYFSDFGVYQSTALTMNNPFTSENGVTVLDSVEWGTARTETTVWPLIEVQRPYIAARPFYTSGVRPVAELFCDVPLNFNATYRDGEEQVSVANIDQLYTSVGPGFKFQYLVPPPYLIPNIELNNVPAFRSPLRSRKGDDDYLVNIEKNPGPIFVSACINTATYDLINLDGGAVHFSPELGTLSVETLANRCTHTGYIDNSSAYSGDITILFDSISASVNLGSVTLSVTQGERVNFTVDASFPTIAVPNLQGVQCFFGDPGTGNVNLRFSCTTTFSDDLGASEDPIDINIVGVDLQDPVWVSRLKPPSSVVNATDAVIKGFSSSEPLWTSQVQKRDMS